MPEILYFLPDNTPYVSLEAYEKLQKQLPESMQNCTILFKGCPLGHGWLTATNWVPFECPTCERDKLRNAIRALTGDR